MAQDYRPGDDSVQLNSIEISFLNYLVENANYKEVLFGTSKLLNTPDLLTADQMDSVCFLRGWSFYQLQKSDSAVGYLRKVRRNSPLGEKSKYYAVFNSIYIREFDSADSLLIDKSPGFENLDLLDKGGIYLLKKNLAAFDSIAGSFDFNDYTMAAEQHNLIQLADTLRKYPKKSGVLAGVMSAVVPGSGKVYTGKTAQGIAVFLETAALGLAATEYYVKKGPQSAGFIVFGSLFTFFYIGNIWGSALSVHVNRTEFYERIDNNIMVDLHVPLRRIFD
ncbi:MAG TPA: hypothetical protein VFW78_01375 [Bacteroidia bacterium]|nr:hypothetical protein [Bacteroidia bacterium]